MATASSFAYLRAGPRVMHGRSLSEHSHETIGRRCDIHDDPRQQLIALPAVVTSVTSDSPPHLAGGRQGGRRRDGGDAAVDSGQLAPLGHKHARAGMMMHVNSRFIGMLLLRLSHTPKP